MSHKRKKSQTGIFEKSLRAILKKIKINNKYDVPYIAGYSKNGKTIYIDRRLPLFISKKHSTHKRTKIAQFLALHEICEKALIKELGHIHYEFAHEMASMLEKKIVSRANVNLRHYNQFIDKYGKYIEKEKVRKAPPDLDLKPYMDENAVTLIRDLKKYRPKRKNK